MKKVIILIALFFVTIALQAQVAPIDTDGNGYRNISTLEHLRWLSENKTEWGWGKYYELDNDIDAGDTKNWNDGKGFSPIGNSDSTRFNGRLDGNNFVIKNLYINRPEQNYVGLFGYTLGITTEIKDIGIIDCIIKGNNYVGVLSGRNYQTIISNSYSSGSVEGNSFVGGLSGNNYYGAVVNSNSSTNTYGNSNIGGLVGENRGTVFNSSSIGKIYGTEHIGGLVGQNFSGTIANSYSLSNVNGIYPAGGLIGTNLSLVSNCYSAGLVSGIGSAVGGLVGKNTASVLKCFWDTDISGQKESDGGIGKTTEEMQIKSTYTDSDWVFEFIWDIDGGYPFINIDISYRPDDTDNDGFLNIKTLMDLRWLSESGYDLFKNWEIDNDIYAYNTKKWNGGAGFFPISYFTGKFYGNNNIIYGLHINRPNQYYVGLFGLMTGSASRVKNLGLKNANITGSTYVGGLVGYNYNTPVMNSYYQGSVKGIYYYVGGLIGLNNYSVLSNCYSVGNITGEPRYAGGLIGYNYRGTISKCFSEANVNGNDRVGGFIGWNNNLANVYNCYSTGSVKGTNEIGGFIGRNINSKVSFSYSTGSVEGNNKIGGFMGENDTSTVISCFWDKQTSECDSSITGIGNTKSKMKTIGTYTDANWDFNSIWDMDSQINYGYPYLKTISVDILEKLSETVSGFSIYPNPILKGNILNISLPSSFLDFTITIYDLKGNVISKHYSQKNIPISNVLIKGNYFIVIENNKGILGCEQFIVK